MLVEKMSWRPKVIISVAMSLDGIISLKNGESAFSSDDDWKEVHKLRHEADGILVGVNTILADDPKLTVKYVKNPSHPTRFVFDNLARTPLDSKILTWMPEVPTIIFTGKNAPDERIKKLEAAGATVIKTSEEKIPLEEALHVMKKEFSIKYLMVEGGGQIIYSFVMNGFFDELRLSIAPILVGTRNAIPFMNGPAAQTLLDARRLKLKRFYTLGENIILYYCPLDQA